MKRQTESKTLGVPGGVQQPLLGMNLTFGPKCQLSCCFGYTGKYSYTGPLRLPFLWFLSGYFSCSVLFFSWATSFKQFKLLHVLLTDNSDLYICESLSCPLLYFQCSIELAAWTGRCLPFVWCHWVWLTNEQMVASADILGGKKQQLCFDSSP